jgi:hypothetical protein
MANYIGPQAAEGFMHEFSGWVIFVVPQRGGQSSILRSAEADDFFVRKRMGWYPKDESAVSRAKVSP